jgi:hypothetical protein
MPTSFSLDLAAFVAKAKGNANQIMRKVSIDAMSRLILRSPVDTGRFRANWIATLDAPTSETVVAFDPNGSATIEANAAAISDVEVGQSVFITNNLPYSERLENGYSDQAPNGMVRLTAAEFQEFVAKAVRELP